MLEELSKSGTDAIIMNPKDIEKLKELGLVTEVRPRSIKEVFEERLSTAIETAKRLPPLPNELLSYPNIQYPYQETRDCVLFGLNLAAITLSGILVEFTLKYVTFIMELGGHQNYDSSKWDEFENNVGFHDAINRAKRVGLLESEIAMQLQSFRDSIRNSYSHYKIKKITENVEAEKVSIFNLGTTEREEKDITSKDSPVIQTYVKPLVDKKNVLSVFLFTDFIIRYLINRLEKNLERIQKP